jgi:serine/threonine protein kinase
MEQIRNEKAKRYLSSMRRKRPIPLTQKFPNADPLALRLLEKMLAFDPKDRPSAEEVFFFLNNLLVFLSNSSICPLNVNNI